MLPIAGTLLLFVGATSCSSDDQGSVGQVKPGSTSTVAAPTTAAASPTSTVRSSPLGSASTSTKAKPKASGSTAKFKNFTVTVSQLERDGAG